jgi:hypothetical protein
MANQAKFIAGSNATGGFLIGVNNTSSSLVFTVGAPETTTNERFRISSASVVFNDAGENVDFRIEGDADQNLFFADASEDKVGIGTNSPAQKLDVRGAIVGQSFVSPRTGATSPGSADSRTTYTNEGAGAQVAFTLPSAAAGIEYTFIVQDTDGLIITAAAGDTIRLAGSVSATGGTADSATIGNVLRLLAINTMEWIATYSIGTWTIT